MQLLCGGDVPRRRESALGPGSRRMFGAFERQHIRGGGGVLPTVQDERRPAVGTEPAWLVFEPSAVSVHW